MRSTYTQTHFVAQTHTTHKHITRVLEQYVAIGRPRAFCLGPFGPLDPPGTVQTLSQPCRTQHVLCWRCAQVT